MAVEVDPGGTGGDPLAPPAPNAGATVGATYEFIEGAPTVQVLGPDIVRDAQRITARATQSGVVYSLLFAPYPTDEQGNMVWTPAAIQSQLAFWANVWNQNSLVAGVASIGLSQQVDNAGQLRDIAVVNIVSSTGLSATQLILYPRDFFPDTFPAAVTAARDALNGSEQAV